MVSSPRALAAIAALLSIACGALASCVAVLDLPAIELVEGTEDATLLADAGEAGDEGRSVDADCGDVSSDPLNCGRCGRVCPGACMAGACPPVQLAPIAAPVAIVSLALTAEEVFFLTQKQEATSKLGEILRCNKGGCNHAPASVALVGEAVGLDVTATHAGWVEVPAAGALSEARACVLAQCSTTKTSFPGAAPGDRAPASTVAVVGGSLYWSDYAAVRTCPIVGCGQPTTFEARTTFMHQVTAAPDRSRFAIVDTEFFPGDVTRQHLRIRALAAGPAVTLTSSLSLPIALAMNQTDVLFIDGSGALSAHRLDASGVTRVQRPVAGQLVAADDAYAYFVPSEGVVARCRIDACVEEIVAKDLGVLAAIAVDARFVYVATTTGLIELAKP